MNICIYWLFSAFSDHVDQKYWGCLHFRILCSLTLFPVCFFRFSSILLASSMIRRRVAIFAIQYSIGIFGTGLIFLKRLERVISSGEVSEESIVLRVLYDGSGEMEHLHQQQRKQLYSKQIQRGAPCDVEWFDKLLLRFWSNSLKVQKSTIERLSGMSTVIRQTNDSNVILNSCLKQ